MINDNENEAENKKCNTRYDINGHEHKYTKYNMCLTIKMILCIKPHLRSIWSSTHVKVKQHWGWVKKIITYKKHVFSRTLKTYSEPSRTSKMESFAEIVNGLKFLAVFWIQSTSAIKAWDKKTSNVKHCSFPKNVATILVWVECSKILHSREKSLV